MPHRRLLLLVALAALFPTACSTDCSSTVNSADAAGVIRDGSDVRIGDVFAITQEQTQPQYSGSPWTLHLQVSAPGGSPLVGHVTGGRLESASGDLLMLLPADHPVSNAAYPIISADTPLPSAQQFVRMRDALLSANARVILDTDLPALPHVTAVLSETHWEPARERRCPYT